GRMPRSCSSAGVRMQLDATARVQPCSGRLASPASLAAALSIVRASRFRWRACGWEAAPLRGSAACLAALVVDSAGIALPAAGSPMPPLRARLPVAPSTSPGVPRPRLFPSGADAADAEPRSDGVVRVGGATPVPKLAGAIAHTIRATGKCTVSAIGAAAVNQAVKGIVSARFYLEESGADVEVTARTNRDVGVNAAAKLGGALASNAREGKGTEAEPLCCVGIGANAVLAMVKAVAFASLYVEEEGITVSMVPEKTVVPMTVDGESVERTALRLAVIARKA
ncbi:unnamed protein product, partial [Symbiodinium sp. KB8]